MCGLLNALLWLGWLRSSEALGLRWCDFEMVRPADSQRYDLPHNTGAVLLRLAPETKSNRSSTSDVVIAYRSASGLSLGYWVEKAMQIFQLDIRALPSTAVFTRLDGSQWTSSSFRQLHLYPHLRRLRDQGDAYLCNVTSILSAFWSLHSYRRGARSYVSNPPPPMRRARPAEVYEHARWRRRQGQNEAIDKVYESWTLYSRLQLTLLCM